MIGMGSKVVMNSKGKYKVSEEDKGKVFEVRSNPFEMLGTICVLLKGKVGGYAIDGLTEVTKMTENETIEILKDFDKQVSANGAYQSTIGEMACKVAISALEEIQPYRALGTAEEIKEIMQIISEGQDDVDESGISVGLLHTLLKYSEYAKLGTVEELREAMEKQRAKKRIKGKIYKTLGYYQCPVCGDLLTPNEKFCEDCGQVIDWSEEE